MHASDCFASSTSFIISFKTFALICVIADLVDDVSDSSFTEFSIPGLLPSGRRHHHSRHVDTAASTEKTPEQHGYKWHGWHDQQDDRHPLVIADYLSGFPRFVFHVRYPLLSKTAQHKLDWVWRNDQSLNELAQTEFCKTILIKSVWHNFTSSQNLLIIFGRRRRYLILSWPP